MTMAEMGDEALGVEHTFPRPGWVVLDAVRERRFTGEVVFDTTPEARVYADRGRIYLAERSSDPSLGARLVDAGALNATQLEHGAMRIGDGEHLGRLFERVPSVDRQKVLVTAELMTEECVGWLASQRISHVAVTPYRHHASGVQRWDQPYAALVDLAPGDPLPAPAPDAAPVAIGPPEPLFRPVDDLGDVDDMIRWNEPSWLDEQVAPLKPIDVAARFAALRAADTDAEHDPISFEPARGDTPAAEAGTPVDAGPSDAEASSNGRADAEHADAGDWIDELGTAGLPQPGSDPLASPVKLAPLATEPMDHFELIWPSGDIDEQFGSQTTEPYPHPDIDRAGVTARLVGKRARVQAEPAAVQKRAMPPADKTLATWLGEDGGREAITDDVVLAVRRAVASIDTGSLAARRRLVDVPVGSAAAPPAETPLAAAAVPLPGRVAVRTDSSDGVANAAHAARGHVSGTSVFDNLPPTEPVGTGGGGPVDPVESDDDAGGEPHRASALRRLIGSLRRR
ncbi:MAG TPA: hypothetical protein VE487_20165 [Ilumatobacter sp.]|jgi:hypothetical protein|nr:hypothetical protein [Ilumatobacter sp.]